MTKQPDLDDPLAQFNCALTDRAGFLALFRSLNKCLGTECIKDEVLLEAFEMRWQKFEARLARAVAENVAAVKVEPKSDDKMLEEILDNTRQMRQRISRLEEWSNHQLVAPAPLVETLGIPASGLDVHMSPWQPSLDTVRETLRSYLDHGLSRDNVITALSAHFGERYRDFLIDETRKYENHKTENRKAKARS